MIYKIWQKVSPWPLGKHLYSVFIWFFVPYTGSLHATVEELRPGHAKVKLRDRWRIRNHLRCVHAAALMNVGELASGIAMISGLKPNIRGIVVSFNVRYLKKARGTLTAIGSCTIPEVTESIDAKSIAKIYNANNELVAETEAVWRLSP